MNVDLATTLVHGFYGYLALGAIFALAFVTRGAAVIDEKAGPGTRGFKLLLVPGAIALWPVLLLKWWEAKR